jgi:hypothetical protein
VRRHSFILPLCLLLACAPARAAAPDDAVPSVQVSGIKTPELRSYRSVVAGLDAFDEGHALAPAVPELRFRLRPSSGGALSPTEGLALRIVGDDGSTPIPIPIAADGGFSVPRLQSAYDSDAILVLNRKKGQFHGIVDVQSPGLPEHVRRLGDLRLECKVTVAIVKSEMSFLARAAVNTIMMTGDWCAKKDVNLSFPSGAPLASAILTSGDRKRDLPFGERSSNYMVPLGDSSWPDDALIELNYAH